MNSGLAIREKTKERISGAMAIKRANVITAQVLVTLDSNFSFAIAVTLVDDAFFPFAYSEIHHEVEV